LSSAASAAPEAPAAASSLPEQVKEACTTEEATLPLVASAAPEAHSPPKAYYHMPRSPSPRPIPQQSDATKEAALPSDESLALQTNAAMSSIQKQPDAAEEAALPILECAAPEASEAEEARAAAEAKAAAEARAVAEAEEARIAAEAKAAAEARAAAEAEQIKLAAEAKEVEEARADAQAKVAEEARAPAEAKAGTEIPNIPQQSDATEEAAKPSDGLSVLTGEAASLSIPKQLGAMEEAALPNCEASVASEGQADISSSLNEKDSMKEDTLPITESQTQDAQIRPSHEIQETAKPIEVTAVCENVASLSNVIDDSTSPVGPSPVLSQGAQTEVETPPLSAMPILGITGSTLDTSLSKTVEPMEGLPATVDELPSSLAGSFLEEGSGPDEFASPSDDGEIPFEYTYDGPDFMYREFEVPAASSQGYRSNEVHHTEKVEYGFGPASANALDPPSDPLLANAQSIMQANRQLVNSAFPPADAPLGLPEPVDLPSDAALRVAQVKSQLGIAPPSSDKARGIVPVPLRPWNGDEAAERHSMSKALDIYFPCMSSGVDPDLPEKIPSPVVQAHMADSIAKGNAPTPWTRDELEEYDRMSSVIQNYFSKGLRLGLDRPNLSGPTSFVPQGVSSVQTSAAPQSILDQLQACQTEAVGSKACNPCPEPCYVANTGERQEMAPAAQAPPAAYISCNDSNKHSAAMVDYRDIPEDRNLEMTYEQTWSKQAEREPTDMDVTALPAEHLSANAPFGETLYPVMVHSEAAMGQSGDLPMTMYPDMVQSEAMPDAAERLLDCSSPEDIKYFDNCDSAIAYGAAHLDSESLCQATAGGSTRSWSVVSLPNQEFPADVTLDAIEMDDLRQLGPSITEHYREMTASRASFLDRPMTGMMTGDRPMTGSSPLGRGSVDTTLQYSPSLPSASGTPWPTGTLGERPSSTKPSWPTSASLPSTPWPTSGKEEDRRQSPSLWAFSSPSPDDPQAPGCSLSPFEAELSITRGADGICTSPLVEDPAEATFEEASHYSPRPKEMRELSTEELEMSNSYLRREVADLRAELDRRRKEVYLWSAVAAACKYGPLPVGLSRPGTAIHRSTNHARE
jgi:hypothetical protein